MHSVLCNTRRPDITFYPNGRIDITSRIAKMLNLCDGDVIDVAVNGPEYMLYIKHRRESIAGSHECTCHASKRNSRNFRTYSRRLCEFMRSVCECIQGTPLYVAAGDAENDELHGAMVPLITKIKINRHD